MKTNFSRKKNGPRLFILVGSFIAMVQYQNCAGPVNQSASSTDPAYVATPVGGSGGTVNGSIVSHAQMLFAASSVELTSDSQALRPGGVCSQPTDSEQIQWQLSEDAVNALVIDQGSESCIHGSFYVNLSSVVASLECDKAYSLSASLPGQGTAQMSILKRCHAVASN